MIWYGVERRGLDYLRVAKKDPEPFKREATKAGMLGVGSLITQDTFWLTSLLKVGTVYYALRAWGEWKKLNLLLPIEGYHKKGYEFHLANLGGDLIYKFYESDETRERKSEIGEAEVLLATTPFNQPAVVLLPDFTDVELFMDFVWLLSRNVPVFLHQYSPVWPQIKGFTFGLKSPPPIPEQGFSTKGPHYIVPLPHHGNYSVKLPSLILTALTYHS